MNEPLRPGDYYIENGRYVFTEQFHLRRGVCCGNACRHCPYAHVNVPEERKAQAAAPTSSSSSRCSPR